MLRGFSWELPRSQPKKPKTSGTAWPTAHATLRVRETFAALRASRFEAPASPTDPGPVEPGGHATPSERKIRRAPWVFQGKPRRTLGSDCQGLLSCFFFELPKVLPFAQMVVLPEREELTRRRPLTDTIVPPIAFRSRLGVVGALLLLLLLLHPAPAQLRQTGLGEKKVGGFL